MPQFALLCRLLFAALLAYSGTDLPRTSENPHNPSQCEAGPAECPLCWVACRAANDGDVRQRTDAWTAPTLIVRPIAAEVCESRPIVGSIPSPLCDFALRRCAGTLRS